MTIVPFPYKLPTDKIALKPPAQRGTTKLLVVNRSTQTLTDSKYARLADWLQPGDLVIINDTKVIAARLLARHSSGRLHEILLTERHASSLMSSVGRVVYRGKLRAGDNLTIGQESLEVIELLGNGQAKIRATKPLIVLAERYGQVPLPPYIKRPASGSDKLRYQTTFAKKLGSVAAPTASLNLTPEIIKSIESIGVKLSKLTLHVGLGTFLPIRAENIEQHIMHSEYFRIPDKSVDAIRLAIIENRRIIAVGTTVTRALEMAADQILAQSPAAHHHRPRHISGEADIFIRPGYKFKIINASHTHVFTNIWYFDSF